MKRVCSETAIGMEQCPFVKGIVNSPDMVTRRIMFLPGGHMGPPLRQVARISGNLMHFMEI